MKLTYPETFNFGYDVVDFFGRQHPKKRALVWCDSKGQERCFTFQEIMEGSNRIANVLRKADIQKGDYVMVILKRHYEYWMTAIALHKLGVVLIPATHMLTVKDLVYRLQVSRAKGLICTTQNEVTEKVLEAIKEVDWSLKLWSVGEERKGFQDLKQEMEKVESQLDRQETKVSDPMVLYFTSGTTGNPKGVIHDYSYPLAHILTAKHWHRVKEDGLHFAVAETGWAKASWGKLYGQWLLGCGVMVYDFEHFDPKQLIGIINRYQVTSFCAPPTIYRYLVRQGIPEMPSLEEATTAGEMLAPEVFQKFLKKTGIVLREGYGQTETTLLVGTLKKEDVTEGSMGKASPLYQVELRNQEDEPVEQGEVGEIVVIPKEGVRPVGIFVSYLHQEEQYEKVWRNGIYHTGDAAYQDEKGNFWFHGRFDDLIKTGGFRVGPYEVEHILMEHESVEECSVIGVPDALRGQSIKGVIKLKEGWEESKELELEIKEFCNQKLAEYKWVRQIEFVENMPKTISGKIQKRFLKQT